MKAKINKIGTFDNKTGEPINWEFDCLNTVPALMVQDGEILLAGYTYQELITISKRNELRRVK